MYLLARRPPSTILARNWRLRLPVLWLLRCFLPAWLRLSRPEAVTRKRFLDALWVFILGMAGPRGQQDRRAARREMEPGPLVVARGPVVSVRRSVAGSLTLKVRAL